MGNSLHAQGQKKQHTCMQERLQTHMATIARYVQASVYLGPASSLPCILQPDSVWSHGLAQLICKPGSSREKQHVSKAKCALPMVVHVWKMRV